MLTGDFLIIGGGVIGLTLTLEIRRRRPEACITVVKAERRIGWHGMGRNSGVLHSGICYPPPPPESLKARMSAEGAAAMRNYCTSKDLPLLRLGKVLPTTRAEDDQQLEVLASRAGLNGLDARILSQFKLAIEEVATIPRMSRRVDH